MIRAPGGLLGIGLDPMDAARDAVLRISEIVDMPNVVVTACCPLGLFE